MTTFISQSFSTYNNPEFKELKNLYSNLDTYIQCLDTAEINIAGGLSFTHFIDESGVKSTWALNTVTINLFDNFLKSINFYNNMIELGIGSLHIRGARFITINPESKLNEEYNLDVKTNIGNHYKNYITVALPIDACDLTLESAEKKYIIEPMEIIVWDSLTFKYRMLKNGNKKQVVVLLYLSIDNPLYKTILDNELGQIGNNYQPKSKI
uniref:Aspartyl/asparaginy/proline hydroxylase domain-containing protein n=1 Tax=viral metagenome TaxID=1070528 RepID=A0A6C0ELR8_9ZZZZ